MYLTEEEAKKKWCPQAREEARSEVQTSHGGAHVGPTTRISMTAINRRREKMGPNYLTRCIASECMMWRMSPKIGELQAIDESLDCKPRPDEGYCGLGGKP